MDNQTPSSTLQFFAKVFSVSSYCFNSMNLTLHFLSDLLCLNVWFPQINFRLYVQMANLADANVSEEDKIQVMINQSIYDSVKWVTHSCLLSILSFLTDVFSFILSTFNEILDLIILDL